MPIVEFKNVTKIYKSGEHELRALDGVDLTLEKGKFAVILGLPAGIGVLNGLLAALASEYELELVLGPLTYSVSVIVTFGVSAAVSFIVSRKNKKINMVEALKGEE